MSNGPGLSYFYYWFGFRLDLLSVSRYPNLSRIRLASSPDLQSAMSRLSNPSDAGVTTAADRRSAKYHQYLIKPPPLIVTTLPFPKVARHSKVSGRSAELSMNHQISFMTGLFSAPIPSIPMLTWSPGFNQRGGFCAMPTP
jgi:hypothetical protein